MALSVYGRRGTGITNNSVISAVYSPTTTPAMSAAAENDCCLPKCLIGHDIEIEAAGFSNGACTNCSKFNGTFIHGAFTYLNPCSACIIYGDPRPIPPPPFTAYCNSSLTGYFGAGGLVRVGRSASFRFQIHVIIYTGTGSDYISGGNNYTVDWRLFDADARQALADLCDGKQVFIPFYAHYNDSNNYRSACSGDPATYSNQTTSRVCIWDGSDLGLRLV